MKVAVVHNRDRSGVINTLGIQNRETYDPVTVEAVATALEKGGHSVRIIDGNMHVVEQLRDFMPRVVAGERPGMVFNMAYGIQGVSRYTHLPGLLEMLGVPYVGSSPQAHSLALDKVIAKLLFQSNGIPTPGFWNFATPDDRFDDLAFPAIVKPKMEAMSSGIKIVHDEPELRAAVAEIINEFHQHVLVEQFVAGREFTVGLLGNEDVEALPVVELDLEGDPMGIRADEGRRPRRKICPADLPPEKAAEMQEIARGAFRALGMADFGRIDLRIDEAGAPYALEINSMADLGQSGAYVYSAGVAGYDFESLINRVLNVAAVRYFGAEYAEEEGGGHKRKSRDPLPIRVRAFLRSQTTTIEDGLRTLAESRTDTAIETVAGQLGQIGFQLAPSDHAPADEDLLYFVNHAHPKNDVLLLASLEGEDESRAGSYREEGTRVSGAFVGGRGCLTVMTAALRALRFARVLRGIKCGVLIVRRGSARGGTARKDLERIARHSGRVLGVSASEPVGTVFASRTGMAHYRVELTPRRDRASRAASPPKAVAALCQRVTAVHRLSRPDSGVTVGVSRLQVSGAPEGLPDEAFAELAVLFKDPKKGKELDLKVKKLLAGESVPGVRVHVHGGIDHLPMVHTPQNAELLAEAEGLGKRLHVAVHGASSWTPGICGGVPAGVATLDGLGPWGAGGEKGWIRIDSLVDRAALLALLVGGAGKAK